MSSVKRILGLVASFRRGSNSEVLVRKALEAAEAAGARPDILFLGDLRVDYCDGCLTCVFGPSGCHKDDDVPWLFDLIAGYDGLIIAAPTYLLSPAAQVKALIDRSVARGTRTPERPRPTATIAVAGLPGWEHLAAPILNQLGLLLGGRIVDSLTAYAAGPGEALLDETLLEQVSDLGRAVAGEHPRPAPSGVCPICRLPRAAGAKGAPCPLCGYDPRHPEGGTRFDGPRLRAFVEDWMRPTRDRFLAHRGEVKTARERLVGPEPRRLRPGAGATARPGGEGEGWPSPSPRLLGVIASPREGGNSELLGRLALQAAAERGATADLIHLADLDLGFCDGCLACVYKATGCPKSAHASWLFDAASTYDGVIVACPTYFLGPPAPVKTLIDHGVMEFPRLADRRPRPAAVITVGGLPGWDYIVRPIANQLAMLLGGHLLGSMVTYAPGPGEALLDTGAVERAREVGRAVLEDRPLGGSPGTCPVCELPVDAAPEEPGGPVTTPGPCPFCLSDPATSGADHRFTRENLARHLAEWMLPSRERFLAERETIREARRTELGPMPRRVQPETGGGAVS